MSFDETSRASLQRAFGTRAAALLMVCVALSLVCCTRQQEPARHTVAEYRADPAWRREQFARCSNDPGTLGNTPDCINVRQATLMEDNQSVRDLPPIRLPPPSEPPRRRE
jgi:hypothetical protein